MKKLLMSSLAHLFDTKNTGGMLLNSANGGANSNTDNLLESRTVTLARNKQSQDAIETYFQASDGREIPVLKDYRYGLKECWRMFGPLAAFAELDERELLNEDSRQFFRHAKGNRTPLVPMAEVRRELAPYLERHEELFLSTNIPNIGKRLLKPTRESSETRIQKMQAKHAAVLREIKRVATVFPGAGEKALEIGFTSGGESIIALERNGFNAAGIDNFYQDNVTSVNRHQYIAELFGADIEFIIGDITRETPVPEATMAYIYSLSVLEHIADISSAFNEMYRVLKPGGVMYHRYDPYFHARGGHSPTLPDYPWAHLSLSPEDLERYIRTLRPHEADITIPWIRSALNRNNTQAMVQKALSKAGFRIRSWVSTPVPSEYFADLTSDILQDCQSINDGVSLDDLLAGSVAFIAEKPLH